MWVKQKYCRFGKGNVYISLILGLGFFIYFVSVFNAPPQKEAEESEDMLAYSTPQYKSVTTKNINGIEYPSLTTNGNFVPIRRWVHIDMKGAPYKVSYYQEIFPLLKNLSVNGILFEWEDMFPYTGVLANAVNGNAYTMDQVEVILTAAKEQGFEIVPLVQTFGHLEWVLKLTEFEHLRDDPKYPQVICIGKEEAWNLIVDMLNQVISVYQRFTDLHYVHIGADEIFHMGICKESAEQVRQKGSEEEAILWHIARTAQSVKKILNVTVLAWHDMIEKAMPNEIIDVNISNLIEPVLWSYAEDLSQYLQPSTWEALKSFKSIWVASVFKGADGPMRYSSNPIHYIRNQESWIIQMTRVYTELNYIPGMIFSGWSRYDHMAVLCETFPVALPTLAMAMETILEGRPLNGKYNKTQELLSCQPPQEPGYTYGCQFPGHRIYELVNELYAQHNRLEKYRESDFSLNGWLSVLTEKHEFSSAMSIEKILPFINSYLQSLEQLEKNLREEMSKIFFDDLVDEFIDTYIASDLQFLRSRRMMAFGILKRRTFSKRPFVRSAPTNISEQSNI